MTPRVAYIIAAFNAERTLARTLRSVQGQTEARWEAIVVDDGSTDGTASVAGAMDDPRIRVVRVGNSGPARARAHGVARAQAERVVLLDADDTLAPSHAARLLSAMGEQDASACGMVAVDEAGNERDYVVVPRADACTLDRVLDGCPLQLACAMLQRRVLERVVARFGSLMDDECHCEDWEFWMRVARVGCTWGPPVPEPLVHYTRAAGTRSRELARTLASGAAALRQHAGEEAAARVRRFAVRVLGRAIASDDGEAVEAARALAGPLEAGDEDLLAGAMHGQYRLDLDMRAGDWPDRVERAFTSIRRFLPACGFARALAFRACVSDEAWREVAQRAAESVPPGGRLVLAGYGQNARALARHLPAGVRLACMDDREDIEGAPARVGARDLNVRDLVLVTPHERGGLLRQLAGTPCLVCVPEDWCERPRATQVGG